VWGNDQDSTTVEERKKDRKKEKEKIKQTDQQKN
jgi:hypothetical protein